MASDVRTHRDLEDRPPLATLAASVLQNARNARAPHIDGTVKLSNKRLRGPRSTDAQKFESVTPQLIALTLCSHLLRTFDSISSQLVPT